MTIRSAAAAILALTLSSAAAWTPETATRRQALSNLATAAAGAAAVVATAPSAASAIDACPPGSNNCVRAKWTPPSGTSKADAAKAVREALTAYPQSGQEGGKVDGGGWAIVKDDLDGSGTAALEYKSAGTGFFAKAFNGGKPFVDDLKVEIEDGGVVQIRSASRIGDSDFGVNQKRCDALAAGLKAKGWSV
mmetsp:Transcript_3578/g.10164  ORF Transcript_3578/g.10164 Transcript_3578/m.10164 type:complete len:192 (+) Transcript_3578:19-594(+)